MSSETPRNYLVNGDFSAPLITDVTAWDAMLSGDRSPGWYTDDGRREPDAGTPQMLEGQLLLLPGQMIAQMVRLEETADSYALFMCWRTPDNMDAWFTFTPWSDDGPSGEEIRIGFGGATTAWGLEATHPLPGGKWGLLQVECERGFGYFHEIMLYSSRDIGGTTRHIGGTYPFPE